MSKNWEMPEVMPGMMVYWYMDGNRSGEPRVGVVTRVWRTNGEPRAISLNLFQENTKLPQCLSSCRHVEDPDLGEQQKKDFGAWDHHPWNARIMELERTLRETRMEIEKMLVESRKLNRENISLAQRATDLAQKAVKG